MTTKRFKFNGRTNCIEYDNKSILLDSYGEDIEEILNELNDENEQLKKAIAETEKMVQSTYDELTKLRCFKKNILRIKHSWDYLMEAIQYD